MQDFGVTLAPSGNANATYTEPSKNSDGSSLTDLKQTEVYYQIGTAAAVQAVVVPASKASGGGAVSTPLSVPVPAGVSTTVSFWATAMDTAGNESAKSAVVTKTFDLLTPDVPLNFTIA